MAMAKSAMTVFAIMALFGAAMAAVYNVGDDAGWTAIGNVDYKKWADNKNFHVGDTLVFKYNAQMHDVKQVSEADFQACNGRSPIATYMTGSDSITLKAAGKFYFLCGATGHCQAGQKVEIQVSAHAQSPGGSPASSPNPSKSGAAPSPSKSAIASAPTGSDDTASTPTSTASTEASSSSTPPPESSSSSASSLYSSIACLVSALLAAAFAL